MSPYPFPFLVVDKKGTIDQDENHTQQSHASDRLQGWWWDEPSQVTARLDQSKPLDGSYSHWVGFALEWVVAGVGHVPFCVINPISVSLSRIWERISVGWFHRQTLYSTHGWAFVCCKLTWHGYVMHKLCYVMSALCYKKEFQIRHLCSNCNPL